jgi:prepilin-type N-terminal cleavage/methylation domain-containing protein
MHKILRPLRASGSQDGFTIAELLAAVFVIAVGLVAVGAGFSAAIQGTETARQQTTATFIAEQRLEQIRATALHDKDIVLACLGPDKITAACFPDQAYGSIPNAPTYRTHVTITLNPAGFTGNRIDVDVWYKPVVAWGVLETAERRVTMSTLIADRT